MVVDATVELVASTVVGVTVLEAVGSAIVGKNKNIVSTICFHKVIKMFDSYNIFNILSLITFLFFPNVKIMKILTL